MKSIVAPLLCLTLPTIALACTANWESCDASAGDSACCCDFPDWNGAIDAAGNALSTVPGICNEYSWGKQCRPDCDSSDGQHVSCLADACPVALGCDEQTANSLAAPPSPPTAVFDFAATNVLRVRIDGNCYTNPTLQLGDIELFADSGCTYPIDIDEEGVVVHCSSHFVPDAADELNCANLHDGESATIAVISEDVNTTIFAAFEMSPSLISQARCVRISSAVSVPLSGGTCDFFVELLEPPGDDGASRWTTVAQSSLVRAETRRRLYWFFGQEYTSQGNPCRDEPAWGCTSSYWHCRGDRYCSSAGHCQGTSNCDSDNTPVTTDMALAVCEDDCHSWWGADWTNDGWCDDGGEGAEYSGCDYGTDCSDCGARGDLRSPPPPPPPPPLPSPPSLPPPMPPGVLCSDDCTYASDDDCDDGGAGAAAGAEYTLCALGDDCADCGRRAIVLQVHVQFFGGNFNCHIPPSLVEHGVDVIVAGREVSHTAHVAHFELGGNVTDNKPELAGYQTGTNFAAVLSAAVPIHTGGTYTFSLTLGNGDTAVVYVDGAVVLSTPCSWGSTYEATVELEAGVHAVRVLFTDDGWHDHVLLQYSGPDTDDAIKHVPTVALSEVEWPAPPPPAPPAPPPRPPTLPMCQQPMDVVLVLDASGSMEGAPMAQARLFAKELVHGFPTEAHFGVVSFGHTGDWYHGLQAATLHAPISADRAATDAAIDAIDAEGWTSISAGLGLAQAELGFGLE